MYKGDNIDAKPTPIPPIILYTINTVEKVWSSSPKVPKNISGIAEPKAEIKNKIAARINPFFRPSFLLTNPPTIPPIIQPINALDTKKPLKALAAVSDNPFGIPKKLSKDPTVPEITPVSYPNKSPPKVATNVILIK